MVEDYTLPFLVSAFVLVFMALFAIWAIWGLVIACLAGALAERLLRVDLGSRGGS